MIPVKSPKRILFLCSAWCSVLCSATFFCFGFASAQNVAPSGFARSSSVAAPVLPRLLLAFESNLGQFDKQVQFLTHGSGYNLYLTGKEAVVVMKRPTATPSALFAGQVAPAAESRGDAAVVRMELVGANASTSGHGLHQLPGYSNYFLGSDPKLWRTHVPQYQSVRFDQVYPGVNVVYYGRGRELEYDFVVAPRVDPRKIAFNVKGGDIAVDASGTLVVTTADGDLQLQKPTAYQNQPDGTRRTVAVEFALAGPRVTFALGAYDHGRELVIDPVVRFSTYLGGSSEDRSAGVAVDKSGNMYIAGSTESADFPTLNSIFPFVGGCTTCHDLFVAKLNPSGSALLYSTYIGGSGDDLSVAAAVDSAGELFVVGSTSSADFPTTVGAYQQVYGGSGTGSTGILGDAYALKLNAAGSALVYSTYIGGSSDELASKVVLDSQGNAYISGETASSNFPVTPGVIASTCPVKSYWASCYAGWVAKLNRMGSGLTYSTYLVDTDGTNYADTALGLAVDPAGDAYVGGEMGPGFPTTPGAFQRSCGGGSGSTCGSGWVQGFVAKINPTASAYLYATYLGSTGGGGPSEVADLAIDSTGAAYVAGVFAQSTAADFPITPGVAQPVYGGGSGCVFFGCGDDFVSKLNSAGSALVYSTYLGGSGDDSALKIALDSQKNVYVESQTTSTNFPLAHATQATYGGGTHDGAITELNAGGTAFLYSSYLGGNSEDIARGLTLDPSGNIYIVGRTTSTNFPVSVGAFQSQCGTDGTCNGGLLDAFATKISPSADLAVVNSAPATVLSGATLTYTLTASSAGPDTALNATITDATPTGTTFKSVTAAAGVVCTKPAVGGTGKIICTVPALRSGQNTVETLVVTVTASSGTTISDKATVSFGGSDPRGSNNSSTASTLVN